VAVYTEDNALLGKMIVAAVVPTDSTESVASLKKRIRVGCAARLAAFKVPSKVVLASESLYSARLKKVRRAKAA
jgi:non-ribosomal peptide synthetase component E (peptide arylation enzyme)